MDIFVKNCHCAAINIFEKLVSQPRGQLVMLLLYRTYVAIAAVLLQNHTKMPTIIMEFAY